MVEGLLALDCGQELDVRVVAHRQPVKDDLFGNIRIRVYYGVVLVRLCVLDCLRPRDVHRLEMLHRVGNVAEQIERQLLVVRHELLHRIGYGVPPHEHVTAMLFGVVPLAVANNRHGVLRPHDQVLLALGQGTGVHPDLRRYLAEPERGDAEPDVHGAHDA